MEILFAAVPSVLATVALGLMARIAKGFKAFSSEHAQLLDMKKTIETMAKEHKALMDSQRNQIKSQISNIYLSAKARGYITPIELDTMNRLADSYFELGGNHYIHTIIKRANHELPIVGESIESLEKGI